MIAKCIDNMQYEDTLKRNKYYKIIEGSKMSEFVTVKGEGGAIVECFSARFVNFRSNDFLERIQ